MPATPPPALGGACPAPAGLEWTVAARAAGAPRFGARCCSAPLTPRGVVDQHGPGRGAAEDRQKAGKDGGPEEDGEAAKFATQPLGHGGATRPATGLVGVPAVCPKGALGTPDWRRVAGCQAGESRATCWALRVCVCVGGQVWRGSCSPLPSPEARLVQVSVDKSGAFVGYLRCTVRA